MLPFPCSTCEKKFSTDLCIIPDTESLLSYTIGVPDGIGIEVNLFEKNTDTGKVMYIAPVEISSFKLPHPLGELTRGYHEISAPPLGPESLNMKISSINYSNTSDSAIGSFLVLGTVTCPKGSYTMNLTATWAFEEIPPAQPIPTVEGSKSGS